MNVAEVLGLFGAGVLAGVVGTVVSLASIISYPVLLAFGLPPVTANVTNTVALTFNGVGAAFGSRPELVGQGARVLRLGTMTLLGGAVGAGLLLATPSDTFEVIAPWLIAFASLLLLRLPNTMTGYGGEDGWKARAAMFTVAIYIGYFGAAGGVLMFAVLSAMLDQPPVRINALKNVVSALANGVAAIGFALFGPVEWAAAVPLALGFLLGGRLGPVIARLLPGRALRLGTAACGLLVALKLGVDAYT
ncbi:sulfite exporter TauE/SafE family protein [Streptosporangium sp. NBC_01755]|uniref:sulfite exporter TauE/SafE family protein n=1 Tax=unclassified Streptosporangium TaxID=2632669 RepID=UPI002DDB8FE0|nr:MULTISPECIES: sulfite exporter TauE/SafE family protein [unclassified Streptosporangium]WSA28374.1 sulfite exporter TauE/SafE family protein [Streptosporangium sp. NBC_01810]WSD00136.1 sulfite exporter TauE/SafE family protein [Streptosporangium sp. NBC_01755]